jgi:hypothetical protein
MAMLDGIVMDIIHMILIIPLIANGMLPVTSLPDATFGFTDSAFGDALGFWYSH